MSRLLRCRVGRDRQSADRQRSHTLAELLRARHALKFQSVAVLVVTADDLGFLSRVVLASGRAGLHRRTSAGSGSFQRSNHSFTESGLRLLGRKALSRIGGGVAGAWWPVPRQRVQGTICGGSGSAVRMRIVPRPRQVGHTEDMGLPGCVDADAPHVVVLGALSTSAYRPVPLASALWMRKPASAGLSFGGLIRSGCREPLYPKSGRLFFFLSGVSGAPVHQPGGGQVGFERR